MVLKLKNPYTDDEIFTTDKGTDKIIEEYIQGLWNLVGVSANSDVAWGEYGSEAHSSGKTITLRCKTFDSPADRISYGGGRWSFVDNMNIDIYVLNSNPARKGRDPKGFKIFNWLRQFFIINQGKEHKGIFEINFKRGYVDTDPVRPDVTKVKITIEVVYVGDIIDE